MAMLCVGVTGMQSTRADGDSVQAAARTPVSFHLASTKAVRGYERMTIGNDTVYVAPKAALSGSDVPLAEAIEGTGLDLALTDGTAGRLSGLMRKHGADRLAVYVGGRLVITATVSVPGDGDRAILSGLSSKQAQHLARVLNGETLAGPTMMLVPTRSTIQPGESVVVDLFLAAVSDCRTYQAGVEVTGGTRGQLVVEDLAVLDNRPDYVFGTRQKIDAVDEKGRRLGATLFDGGVDVGRPMHLGNFTLRASPDAAGSFEVSVRMDETSFLRTSGHHPIQFYQGPTATINVGAPGRIQPRGR
jgi:hypothetical protein